jgi:hypothetical protein
MPQPRRVTGAATSEKQVPSLANNGYFSDYYLTHRLDAGLSDLYARWDELDKQGEPNERTRVRNLTVPFGTHRADAALTAPDADVLDAGTLDLGDLHADAKAALLALNDAILTSLGWAPDRDADRLTLTTGEKTIAVPAAHIATTPTGVLLVALDTVFATDPAAVIASMATPAGRLVEPVLLNDKPAARTALEAAQLIFTADDAPSYLLLVSGGAITLLDRERWGEGISIGANLDDALARHDTKPKGELAAIAALFGAGAINPGDQAQSVLTSLLEKAGTESAGVSKELRHGIRRSVELLANAVVDDVRERQKGAWMSLDPKALTRQSLRYLYRIIVLLFAEARPELGILPVDDPDYQTGYSVARLRDVALVDLQTPHGQHGRHIQQSLDVLFRLVNDGHDPDQGALGEDARDLVFPGLRSTLFDAKSCALLDKAHLHDGVLQQVIQHLCFTRERAWRGRQPVSYSTLGINQLGAVYEGLMAYSGFLATEPLFEIDKDGDPDNGSWVIPVHRADEFPEEVFLKEILPDGSERRVRYEQGEFVFRLSGRDRQRSASYYTPEVLTEFTVRHALDVLFDENPDLTARDILNLTVCEPALGSGAFLTEAVTQLAHRYLKAAQDESGEVIDADRYQLELQRAKAHFAVNQAYGVDLNQTAVELAEVSLWLACMHEGLQAPWFGARLRRGNSLVGARRETYTREQVAATAWAGKTATAPTPITISETPLGTAAGIHHFLVPGQGWGAAADAQEIKELKPEWVDKLKAWRNQIHKKPTGRQIDRLALLARRVEELWADSAVEVERFWKATRQHIDVWGADTPEAGERFGDEPIRTVLRDTRSATMRLRTLMDAWCSLWLWAPQHGSDVPPFDEWLTVAEALLRIDEPWESGALFADERELALPEAASIDDVAAAHPWLALAREIATTQGWFHWELEFAPVFAGGAFDVQVGNPPWVRPRWSDEDTLAEHDPWFGVTDPIPENDRVARRNAVLEDAGAHAQYLAERAENAALGNALGAVTREPLLAGQQTNLYLMFITGSWRRSAATGATGLLHPDGHLSNPKAAALRAAVYRRYREAFHFINELKLFKDIEHTRPFSVNVYSGDWGTVGFTQSAFLYHPLVVDRSRDHDGSGDLPGGKLLTGEWDVRPHRERLAHVTDDTLRSWAALLAYDDPASPPLVKFVTSAEASAADAIARYPHRLGGTKYFWTAGFHEQTAPRKGLIEERTSVPTSWDEVILQGPHIGICNLFAKQPRPSGRNIQDYEPWDLEHLPETVIPRTNWQRAADRTIFEREISEWDGSPNTDRYRLIVRRRVPFTTSRSVYGALLPPRATAVSVCYLGALATDELTVAFTGMLAGLLSDFLIRLMGAGDLHDNVIARFPVPEPGHALIAPLVHRVLRLNCLTREFAELWESLVTNRWTNDEFTQPVSIRSMSAPPSEWSWDVPMRSDFDRWLLGTEIDALGALIVGVDVSGLAAAYQSQFPVLVGFESSTLFDRYGRQVAAAHHNHGYLQARLEAEAKENRTPGGLKVWDRVQRFLAGDADVDLGPFKPPFRPADRVAAMTNAYWTFVDRYNLSPPDFEDRPS